MRIPASSTPSNFFFLLRRIFLPLALAALFVAPGLWAQDKPATSDISTEQVVTRAHDLQKAGKIEDAIGLLRKSIAQTWNTRGRTSPDVAELLETLGDLYVARVKAGPGAGITDLGPYGNSILLDAAAMLYQRAIEIQEMNGAKEAKERVQSSLAALDKIRFRWTVDANQGAVVGTVYDAVGQPLQGATVVLKNAKSGYSNSVTTDGSGAYQFEHVPPGDGYEIHASTDTVEIAYRAGFGVFAGELRVIEPPLTGRAARPVFGGIASGIATGQHRSAREQVENATERADAVMTPVVGEAIPAEPEPVRAPEPRRVGAAPPPPPPPPPPPRPTASAEPPKASITSAGGAEEPPSSQTKAEYTFPDAKIEGELERPGEAGGTGDESSAAKPPEPQRTGAANPEYTRAAYTEPSSGAPGSTTLERYPSMESPDQAAPGQEFAVQVSLTEEQIAPETKVVQGTTTAEGKLAISLPATAQNQWNIDVVLSAPGLQFSRGSNTGTLVLPLAGDSTPAMFWLRVPANAAGKQIHLMATLWHQGTYLARIERDLAIQGVQAAAGAGAPAAPAPASTMDVASGPAPAATAKSAVAGPTTRAQAKTAPENDERAERGAAQTRTFREQRASLDLSAQPADLTVFILSKSDPNTETVLINSPFLQPAEYTVPRAAGLSNWLAQQYGQIAARAGRGTHVLGGKGTGDRQSTDEFLRGFGRQLYQQFAPQPFKDAFWTLESKLGARFHTIQIFTDDPVLPWELMRPAREDGSDERDFLGLEFSVARWHVTRDTAQMERPPQTEPLDAVMVIAPQYKGDTALPGQNSELAALQQVPGYLPVRGDKDAVRALFQNLPDGIVHFAGHGSVEREGGVAQYAILLEDGALDLMTWRGMAPLHPAHHPVFFFNACDVGQSQQVVNFVDGWAPAVLRAGASGYIGALWPVNDKVAAEFAARFYQGMEKDLATGPARVSDVLTETRLEIFKETGDPTALAYVFYGDPNLAFYQTEPPRRKQIHADQAEPRER